VHVVLNSFCGYQQAQRCYDEVVQPLLRHAQFHVELHETMSAGDGTRIGKQLREVSRTRKVDLIVLAGDGTVGEILNGLAFDEAGEFGWPPDQIELCIMYVASL
jgi:diacylglycerol kinase family enzyme